MRSLESYLLSLVLSACWLTLTLGDSIGTPGCPAPAAGAGAEEVISRTMREVSSDLKQIQPDFPQLRDLEGATVTATTFGYETGVLQRGTRFKPEIFAKDGCSIQLEVLCPATQDDLSMRQDGGGRLVSLSNGTSYAFWRRVSAGPGGEGQAFLDKVNKIITSRLDAMKKQLEQL
jgi:hypothetical protein